jgi:hypothetical protein
MFNMRLVQSFLSAGCALNLLWYCGTSHAADLTTTTTQGLGQNWGDAIWSTNGTGTSVAPTAGNTYQCVANGTPFGNSLANTRIRNPAVVGVQTFSGDSLTLNTNTEIRMKQPGAILDFPGVGGNPGLILNGGILNVGDTAVFTITGTAQVASQSYLCPGNNGGGGIDVGRAVTLACQLSGSGNLVLFQATTNTAQEISGNSNTFSGQWIVKSGWLLGSGTNSLGTNSITMDPRYVLSLDPSITEVAGPAVLEVGYDINSVGTLTLTNGGAMRLHQNCAFSAVNIEGAMLSRGTHAYSELAASFPNSFEAGGSGAITVQPYVNPPASSRILVATNSLWAMKKGTAEASTPISAWRTLAFDDSSWTLAPAPFYYDTKATPVYSGNTLLSDMANNYLGIFLRRPFVITNAAGIAGLTLNAICDDGYVAWINGTEVARYNMASGSVLFTNHATTNFITVSAYVSLALTNIQSYLMDGTNLLAVQVFNSSKTSSDLLFESELRSIVPDTTPPTLVGFNPAAGILTNLTQITVTFSEPVVGVTMYDLLLNGTPAMGVAGSGAVYTFSFAQSAYGAVQLTWDSQHEITDLASNRFDGTGSQINYTLVDLTPPAVALLNPPAGALVRQLAQVEVRFTEAVGGVEAADLLINGQPAASVTGTASGPYLFQFAPPATGLMHLAWSPGHGIQDLANPPNPFAGGNWDLTLDANAVSADVIINEFLAGAVSTNRLKDEDGEVQGWIELYNQGSRPVSLAGWALTDTAAAPDRWLFPDMMIQPGQYLVVFASGKDRTNLVGNLKLHTNFKLNPSGGYAGLFNAESPRQAVSELRPDYPEQRYDYSYGRDDQGLWRYYAIPTPGARNGNSPIAGMVQPVHFSVNRGLFNAPFRLTLTTTTSNATVRYTTDGSMPSEANSLVYSTSLLIDHTTVFRRS